jgi:hypothetical protein
MGSNARMQVDVKVYICNFKKKPRSLYEACSVLRQYEDHGCGVGVGVSKNVPTPTPTSI